MHLGAMSSDGCSGAVTVERGRICEVSKRPSRRVWAWGWGTREGGSCTPWEMGRQSGLEILFPLPPCPPGRPFSSGSIAAAPVPPPSLGLPLIAP